MQYRVHLPKFQASTSANLALVILLAIAPISGCQSQVKPKLGIPEIADRMTWPMDEVVVVGKRCNEEYKRSKKNTGECEGFEAIAKPNPEPIDYKRAADYMLLRQYNATIIACAKAIKLKETLSSDCKLVQKEFEERKRLQSK
jgi:hypothetical protein